MCAEVTEELRRRAHTLCRDYLHGAWQLVSEQDMVLKTISGGLTNKLFFCELPTKQAVLGDEPSRVLLRIYGQMHGVGHEALTESVIFTLLAERRLGPKLYGIFPGGRFEEFIQAAPLSLSDLRDSEVSQQIAKELAMVHSLQVPICKEPTVMWQTMKKWIRQSHKYLDDTALSEHKGKADIIKALRLCDFESEIRWLRRYFAQSPSPVVFCHHDAQEGNILRHKSEPEAAPRLTLIDYEYCSYNYRGVDLANHFCEWTYDYTAVEYPYFREHPELWPSREQQLLFIRAYLRHRGPATKRPAPVPEHSGAKPSGERGQGREQQEREREQQEEALLQEVRVYGLLSHLFWALWSVVNAPVTTISFGYWEYGLCRLNAYWRLKRHLLETDPRCPRATHDDNGNPTAAHCNGNTG